MIVASIPNRVAIRAVTPDSDMPSASDRVRNRCVARSRSPSPNHAASGSKVRSSSVARKDSSRRPHPRPRSNASPSQYVTESRSGHTRSPCTSMSSPVFTTAVRSASGAARTRPRRNFLHRHLPRARRSSRAQSVVASRRGGRDDARSAARAGACRAGEGRVRARGRRADDRSGAGPRTTGGDRGTPPGSRFEDRVTYSRKVFVPLTMLCRDHCHYCTFAKPPAKLGAPFLAPEEVLAIARGEGARVQGSALHTGRPTGGAVRGRSGLARRPRVRLDARVRACLSDQRIEETGLLPHLNPGVMSYEELARLRHVSASMGLMLETTSERLTRRGGAHLDHRTSVRRCGCGRSRMPVASPSRSPPASSWGSGRTPWSVRRRCSRSATCIGGIDTSKRRSCRTSAPSRGRRWRTRRNRTRRSSSPPWRPHAS